MTSERNLIIFLSSLLTGLAAGCYVSPTKTTGDGTDLADFLRRERAMTNMIRRDPFTDLRSTMDRLFDEGFSRPWRFINTENYEASMPVEVSETDNELVVKASLPGVGPDDVDITVNNDVLTIKAEHKETTEEGKREFYRREIRYGAFNRSF